MKISSTVSEVWSGHEKLTDGQADTDRRTDGRQDIVRPVFDGRIKIRYNIFMMPIYYFTNIFVVLSCK